MVDSGWCEVGASDGASSSSSSSSCAVCCLLRCAVTDYIDHRPPPSVANTASNHDRAAMRVGSEWWSCSSGARGSIAYGYQDEEWLDYCCCWLVFSSYRQRSFGTVSTLRCAGWHPAFGAWCCCIFQVRRNPSETMMLLLLRVQCSWRCPLVVETSGCRCLLRTRGDSGRPHGGQWPASRAERDERKGGRDGEVSRINK